VAVNELVQDKGKLGAAFNKKMGIVSKYLTELDEDGVNALEAAVTGKGSATVRVGTEDFTLTPDMIKFNKVQKKLQGRNVTPGVIEPSFGIGRILYSVLEHAYYIRDNDEQRGVLGLPAAIAPVKVGVLPLLNNKEQHAYIAKIAGLLQQSNISFKVDDSGASIGKRYARTDEIGVPYGLTIDGDTVTGHTITLRERDSTQQVRANVDEVPTLLLQLLNGVVSWEQVRAKYPNVEPSKEEKEK